MELPYALDRDARDMELAETEVCVFRPIFIGKIADKSLKMYSCHGTLRP